MVSNQIVALADMGTALLVKCGFSEAAAAEALSPLLLGNAQSVAEKGAVNALTGPIERGDAQTVSKHLQEIRKFAVESTVGQDILTAYTALSKQLIRIAQQKHPQKDYKHLEKELEDMIHHTAAVTRGAKNALVVGDMPFMSYQTSVYDAVVNAGRLMKEGRCQAVKLEGGASVCPQIKAITEASIPVVAHIGLTPQSVNAFGGFKVQGKSEADARRLIEEAKAVEAAGAFAIVLECIPAKLAKLITESVSIPTIGIGAGADCDGQVLVYQDMLALFSDFKPKFVKHFANAGEVMKQGFTDYIKEVKEGTFPAAEHTFKIADDIINKLY